MVGHLHSTNYRWRQGCASIVGSLRAVELPGAGVCSFSFPCLACLGGRVHGHPRTPSITSGSLWPPPLLCILVRSALCSLGPQYAYACSCCCCTSTSGRATEGMMMGLWQRPHHCGRAKHAAGESGRKCALHKGRTGVWQVLAQWLHRPACVLNTHRLRSPSVPREQRQAALAAGPHP